MFWLSTRQKWAILAKEDTHHGMRRESSPNNYNNGVIYIINIIEQIIGVKIEVEGGTAV